VTVPLNSGATLAVMVTDCPEFEGFCDEVNAVVVVAFLTTWRTVFDVLLVRFESPPYTAVIELLPTGSVEVVRLAEPPLNVTVSSTVVPLINVTVSPFGGAPALEVTTAVKVTACSCVDGFGEDVSVVLLVALLATRTTWRTVFDVLPVKFESPPYTAVIALLPTGNVEVVKLAEPPLNAPVPSTVVPLINVTVSPLGGAPALEATAAEKVTTCP